MTQNHESLGAAAREGSGAMFDGIAPRYDLLNRVLSLGIDRTWRRKTARALELGLGARVLDLATGTADLALAVAAEVPDCQVVGLDPSPRMLEVGRQKVAAKGLSDRIELSLGDAESIAFPDQTFDGVSIAFGIRNVPDREKALREMARVTRTSGRIAILELSEPEGGWLAPLARFHVHTLVPALGALISGAREYRYLQRSIAAFPSSKDFKVMMERCGIDVLGVHPLTLGACHLYVGRPTGSS